MDHLSAALIAVLSVAAIVLFVKLILIKRSLREITCDLTEKLREDTNMQITVSSSDRCVCRLASELNEQLGVIHKERQRLENSNAELQNSITNIAHDLRTPLTAVVGYLELLEQEELGKNAEAYVKVISERTDNLKALTEELFRYSVISTDRDELNIENVSLSAELEIALSAAYRSLTDAGITPQISFSENPVIRRLDKKALQRIFGNILTNTVRYSSGDLSVTLEEDGTVIFSNPSHSLSEIEVGRLFDRFYTVENAKGSTGLGLSIAKLLTEKMGGAIEADYIDGIFNIRIRFSK